MGLNFNKPKTTAAASKPSAPKSKYAGIQAEAPRPPILGLGTYRVGFVSAEEGVNPGKGNKVTHKTELTILEVHDGDAHKVGDVVAVLQPLSGGAAQYGAGRVKLMGMALLGFEDEAAFDAESPDGLLLELMVGNAVSEKYSYEGAQAYVQVTRGKGMPDGTDYYRNYAWGTV